MFCLTNGSVPSEESIKMMKLMNVVTAVKFTICLSIKLFFLLYILCTKPLMLMMHEANFRANKIHEPLQYPMQWLISLCDKFKTSHRCRK